MILNPLDSSSLDFDNSLLINPYYGIWGIKPQVLNGSSENAMFPNHFSIFQSLMMLKKLVLPLLHAVTAQKFNITITSSFNTDIAPGSKVHFSESADTDP